MGISRAFLYQSASQYQIAFGQWRRIRESQYRNTLYMEYGSVCEHLAKLFERMEVFELFFL